MKKTALVIAVALFGMGAGYAGLSGFKAVHDKEGEIIAASVLEKVKEVKARSGVYPAKSHPMQSKIWGIFPGPEVKYHFDGYNCAIHYYQWPLGPHHVLDCRTNEWSFEE